MSGDAPNVDVLSKEDINTILALLTKNGLLKNRKLLEELLGREDEYDVEEDEDEINSRRAEIDAVYATNSQQNINLDEIVSIVIKLSLAYKINLYPALIKALPKIEQKQYVIKEMLAYATKNNNINSFLGVVQVFLSNDNNAAYIPIIKQVLEQENFAQEIIQTPEYLEMIKHLVYVVIQARGNVSNDVFMRFFAGDLENMENLLAFLQNDELVEYINDEIRRLVIANISEEKIMSLIKAHSFFEIDFTKDFWDTLMQRNLPHEAAAILFEKAITYNVIDVIMPLLEFYFKTNHEYLIATLPKSNFELLRVILSEISNEQSPYKKRLWKILYGIFNGPNSENLKEKINAWALVDEPMLPIAVNVMQQAENLFDLTSKIAKLGKSNRNYNPVVLHVLLLDNEPTALFEYYLENYEKHKDLFDIPKDAELKDRLNLLKYMLRYYNTLKKHVNCNVVIDSLLDEDVFAKIDVNFIYDIFDYDVEAGSFRAEYIDPKIIEKIFIPMGFNLDLDHIKQISTNPKGIFSYLAHAPLTTTTPLHCMLAAELVVSSIMPDTIRLHGAQSAHDTLAEMNFNDFTAKYLQHNPIAIEPSKQTNYIKLFILYQLYKIAPNHELFTNFSDSLLIKTLLQNDSFAKVYENYLKNYPKCDLLEYILNPDNTGLVNSGEKTAIEHVLSTRNDNFYADKALIALRGLNDKKNQILTDADLCSGTANLIQYIQSDISYLQNKFTSHEDIADVLLRLTLDEKEISLSSEREELFQLYNKYKHEKFSYKSYANILEKIFLTRLKNSEEVFCSQIADAVTAYLQEGEEVNATHQSCITGYKSRLNQLLDADILYGRKPEALELMQKFLVQLIEEQLQNKLASCQEVTKKREILGQYLSTRKANAALLAAGRDTEILNYFGEGPPSFLSLEKLFEVADKNIFIRNTIKKFEDSAIFNPKAKPLTDKTKWALYNLLLCSGGELVIGKLDKFFRDKYGIIESVAPDSEAVISKDQILIDAEKIEKQIFKTSHNIKNTLQNMAIVRSLINQVVIKILQLKYGQYNENNTTQERDYEKIKEELTAVIYPKNTNKTLTPNEFKTQVMYILNAIELRHEPGLKDTSHNRPD